MTKRGIFFLLVFIDYEDLGDADLCPKTGQSQANYFLSVHNLYSKDTQTLGTRITV